MDDLNKGRGFSKLLFFEFADWHNYNLPVNIKAIPVPRATIVTNVHQNEYGIVNGSIAIETDIHINVTKIKNCRLYTSNNVAAEKKMKIVFTFLFYNNFF